MKYRTLCCLAAVLACTAPRENLKGRSEPTPEPRKSSEGFSLILHNHNYLDVNIFVRHDGQSSRVGTVTGSSSTALVVPSWMVGKGGLIQLIAEPIGDNSQYVTDNLLVQPGQMVELNVESSIARSNYSIQ